MSREIRYVPENWEHHDTPLFDGLKFPERRERWHKGKALWAEGKWLKWNGEIEDNDEYSHMTWEEFHGTEPDPANYTEARPGDGLTHMVMYETTSEGTPISPAFPRDNPEALATWLADNKASSFGGFTATKEEWLGMITKGGWAPGAVMVNGKWTSGVSYMAQEDPLIGVLEDTIEALVAHDFEDRDMIDSINSQLRNLIDHL